jgi:hypothetical protein
MFDYRVIFVARRGRARTLAAAGIAAGLLVALMAPAQAQFLSWLGFPPANGVPENAAIPPANIYRIVAAHGYRVSGELQRNGGTYLVDAVDQRGRALRLVVDAYQGDILQRFATTPPRPPASIPQPQSQANLYPQYQSYPAYPDAAPPSQVTPGSGRKTTDDARRSQVKKTQTAARETGTPTPESARPGRTRNSARTDPEQPQPAVKAEPATAAVTPAPHPPASVPKTDGPGYANGVPINPLD